MSTIKARWWVRAIKIFLWTVMAMVLLAVGLLLGSVKILTPRHLTPIVEIAANKMLNAKVSIAHIELSLSHSAPFLDIDIRDCSIVATDVSSLKGADRRGAPQWADTLFTFSRLRGGINLAHLALGRVTLSDVVFDSPEINLAVIGPDLNNFNIFKVDSTSTSTTSMPAITVRRFAFNNPRPIRYIDAESGASATLSLYNFDLNGSGAPVYKADFSSNLHTPLLDNYNLSELPIRFNGDIVWNSDSIYMLELRNFDFAVGNVSGVINTALNFNENLTVNSFDISLEPINVTQALSLVPLSVWKGSGFDPRQLRTDMSVKLAARLNCPFEASSQLIPDATIDIDVPDCALRWRRVDMRRFGLTVRVDVPGDNLNAACIKFKRLYAQGPATDITVTGDITRLVSDPTFDGRLEGHVNLAHLPEQLLRMLEGSVYGRLTAMANVKISKSMLALNRFHKIQVDGDVDLDEFRYERFDTVTMVDLHHACLKFDSDKNFKSDKGSVSHVLSASIDVDTANIVHSNIAMTLSGFRIAAGALNDGTVGSGDTTLVVPMGGGVKARTFNMTMLTDTFTLKLREVKGNVVMKRFEKIARLPEFITYLNIGRISTGDRSTRVLLSNSTLRFNAHKLSYDKRLSENLKKKITPYVDSIRTLALDVPDDSIFAMALRAYRNRPHTRRVKIEEDSQLDEIIDWDASNDLREFLRGWAFKGTLSSDRVRLFSHYFPLRNRMTNLNVAFDNDSLVFSNVKYKAGKSDFLMSGKVSNIKRAFTSKRKTSPLRINFDLLSDTIDINQLAQATFEGSAYAQNVERRKSLTDTDSDEHLETFIKDHTTEPNDTMAPILIPVNVDAEVKVKANNVIYSDLLMHNLDGTVLLYDGAVSLNNIRARSHIGNIDLSALYSAPNVDDMKFGFGLTVNKFKIANFLDLVPAIDSIMPIMRNFSGIINANIAATTDIDKHMNLVMPSLKANIDLSGDSLVVIDPDTYKRIAKWLLFKNKNRNMIDHMAVQLVVEDNVMEVYPFIFDFDRYRLGVQGSNDLDMNFKYHIAVLKSPIPFKFGINVSGTPDKYKIRLGGAHFNEKQVVDYKQIVEKSRVNLLNQIQGVFRRGVRKAKFAELKIDNRPQASEIDLNTDTISAADSLLFIREGLIPAPAVDSVATEAADSKSGAKTKKKDNKNKDKNKGNNRKKDKKQDENSSSQTVAAAVINKKVWLAALNTKV